MTYVDALGTVIGVIIATVSLAEIVMLSFDPAVRTILLVALTAGALAALVAFPLLILT